MTTDLQAPTTADVNPIVTAANALTVSTQEEAEAGAAMSLQIRTMIGRVNAHHDPIIQAAHRTHKAAKAAAATFLTPLKTAKAIVGDKVGAWQAEQRRIEAARVAKERAEQQAAQIAAEKQREEEQAERTRLAAEAEALNEPEAAEVLRAEPEPLPPPVPVAVVQPVHKITGMRTTERWHAEVVNFALVPRRYLMADQKILDAEARRCKESFSVPGVKAVCDYGSAATG